ncbi:MAG: GNAT family N-acetyltransferase [Erythrobacter sp.]
MAYAIRQYRDTDADALSGVLRSAIAVIGPRAYSEAQVAAWSARGPTPDRYRERVNKGAIIIIAADANDIPVAYTLLEREPGEGGHLDHLYCHPDHTRQGLAVQLLLEAEQHAASLAVQRLYTEASELARPAFERAGYLVTHRRDFEIEGPAGSLNGPVAIHNYAMEKLLD